MRSHINLIEPGLQALSVRQQCTLLSVSRSSLYYQPKAEKPENLEMMKIMDKHLLNHSTEGVVSMVYLLTVLGFLVGPKRIRRLFRLMGNRPFTAEKT